MLALFYIQNIAQLFGVKYKEARGKKYVDRTKIEMGEGDFFKFMFKFSSNDGALIMCPVFVAFTRRVMGISCHPK